MINASIKRQRYLAYSMAFATIVFALLFNLDIRSLDNDESVWIKPIRFALAFGIHAATLIWIYHITGRMSLNNRLFNACLDVQLSVFIIEMLCITLQAARGVHSHFNVATPFDEGIYTIMGIAATTLVFTYPLQAFIFFRQPGKRKVVSYACSCGFIAMVIGCFMGFQMTEPRAAQDAMSEQGIETVMQGAHYVNAPSGNSLPFFSWDTTTGDWRIAHFIGLHGIQLLPLLGLAAYYANFRNRHIRTLFVVSILSYFCFLGFTIIITALDHSMFLANGNIALLWVVCWFAPMLMLLLGIRGYIRTRRGASWQATS